MTKKDRVIATINGESVRSIPSSFSLPFPVNKRYGSAAIKAHLDFFNKTDTDIWKIMNENLVPVFGDIRTPSDYDRLIPKMSMNDQFMNDQILLTREILSHNTDNAFTLGTLHGICASGIHPIEQNGTNYYAARQMQVDFLRWNESKMLSAMQRITDVLCELAKNYIQFGVDAVYYAALGGETAFFSDEEFEKWIKPFDFQIMDAIRDAGGYCFLHICKEGLNMSRYKEYASHADVVNWGVYEAPLSLTDGKKLFPGKTILGGLSNHTGPLVTGTDLEVHDAVHHVINQIGVYSFILGADCTLSTTQDLRLVRAAVEAARNYI